MSQPATEEFETLRQSLGFELPGTTGDGIARARALMARLSAERTPTSLVSYESKGQVLVIARDAAGREVADSIGEGLGVTVLVTDSTAPTADDATQTGVRHPTFYAPLKTLSGHLGDFNAVVEAGEREVALGETLGREKTSFDIVLDLLDPPSIGWEVPPPGYYAPRGDDKVLALALEEIPQMVGEFEKPKFFRYDPDICAHGANGLRGCTRCIDRCPTMAIASVGERIEVDPFLCQGAGSCATACPTGAISYAYPTAADNLDALRDSLRVYREAGGVDPVVLFYDMAQGLEWLTAHASRLPERVLPYAVEEIGSVGPDIWLSALAYGASGVALLRTPAVPALVAAELDEQISFAHAMLRGLGVPTDALGIVDAEQAAESMAFADPRMPPLSPASFRAPDEKRTTIRLALDHLYRETGSDASFVELPENASFGEVEVREGCTLCMACVSTCPAAALEAGGDSPRLSFIEMNCVQCGLCETACPEDVITRNPRFLFDIEARRARRVLNEEAPFNCIRCGKAFATQSIMNAMREKLSGHWMFAKPEALRRLEMCEDCRVKDMMREGGGRLEL